ncbi:MAG: hypothetical protein ACK45V_10690, partial [Brevundimonas sp.]
GGGGGRGYPPAGPPRQVGGHVDAPVGHVERDAVAVADQGAVTIPNPPPAQVFRPAATTTAREDA